MKKVIVYSLLLLASLAVSAQKNNVKNTSKSKDVEKIFADNLEDKFKNDLRSGKLTIYLLGGIVSAIRKGDSEFEKKFQIRYHGFSCIPPSNFEFYEKYNQYVFNHLSKHYGKDWIASANDSAFGFKKWKEKRL